MAAEQTIHLDRYAPDAKALVAGAQSLADERKHAQVEPIHLLARAVDRDRGVQEVFRKAGADPADVSVEAESALGRINKTTAGLAYLSSAMLQLLARAEKEAGPAPSRSSTCSTRSRRRSAGRRPSSCRPSASARAASAPHMAALKSVPRELPPPRPRQRRRAVALHARLRRARAPRRVRPGHRARRRGAAPPADPRAAAEEPPAARRRAGVGKTAIVGALAMRIAAGDVPREPREARILELETGLLVAGAKLRGEIEERLRQVSRP